MLRAKYQMKSRDSILRLRRTDCFRGHLNNLNMCICTRPFKEAAGALQSRVMTEKLLSLSAIGLRKVNGMINAGPIISFYSVFPHPVP
jgi:hypothetical protein